MIKRYLILLIFVFSSYAQNNEVVFVQMNDVYEIAPLEGGKYGGLARVKTIIERIKQSNPNTFVVLSGDFISPSALSTSTFDGSRINGRQMVDVLNAIGLNFVTFGNHEFDYKQDVLQNRINESHFEWISSNVKFINNGKITPFSQRGSDLPKYKIIKLEFNNNIQPLKIGIIGICINSNKQPYVEYSDYFQTAKDTYHNIMDSIDCAVAITHLNIDDDKKLANELPQLKLIMGGHEHINMHYETVGTVIAKADANAKTVYIHRLLFNEKNEFIKITSELVKVDESIPEDPAVKDMVDTWVTRAYKGFFDKGFDPLKMVIDLKNDTLDGREETVRYSQCALGYLIGNAMFNASKNSDLAFFNSGAIRIDDKLTGEVTQYDIIRILPFGGKILQVDLKGSLLKKIIETGFNQPGSGGYLQFFGMELTQDGYKVKGELIDDNKIYNAAVADYLLTGLEQNFNFLTENNPGIIKIYEPDPIDKSDLRNDIRFAIISWLEKWNR
ncbi:MAG: bifunctional metallophosphatase/5'-nucleotidase [Ignavibacteria bacterium]|nr:bifunctional metallophosphatase/5'-nucleotidase [Ignavibacteria bacterium]